MTDVKICGIMTPEALTAALTHGARYVGFLFIPASGHYVEPAVAAYLAHFVPPGVKKVGLFQDADDLTIRMAIGSVPLDMLQLHGAETPGRVQEIKALTGLPVMKAISVREEADLAAIPDYEAAADWLLFDGAKGGSGVRFNWDLLQQYCSKNTLRKPWMLAGGLNERNIEEALARFHPDALDVSSGVESEKYVKDPEKIRAFIEAARRFSAQKPA